MFSFHFAAMGSNSKTCYGQSNDATLGTDKTYLVLKIEETGYLDERHNKKSVLLIKLS